jgi:hypothetical protein
MHDQHAGKLQRASWPGDLFYSVRNAARDGGPIRAGGSMANSNQETGEAKNKAMRDAGFIVPGI